MCHTWLLIRNSGSGFDDGVMKYVQHKGSQHERDSNIKHLHELGHDPIETAVAKTYLGHLPAQPTGRALPLLPPWKAPAQASNTISSLETSKVSLYGLVSIPYVHCHSVVTPMSIFPAAKSPPNRTMVTFGGRRFERQASQILPNLYLSDAMTARWGDTLDRLGVTHIVCVLEEPVTYPRTRQDVKILYIPVSDDVTSDLLSYFESATEFISDALGTTNLPAVNKEELNAVKDVTNVLEGNTHPFPSPDADAGSTPKNVVLVHCLAGMSRSATIVCAYLLATTSMNTQETISFVRSKRSIIQPNYGFEKQLKAWEAKHFVATRKRRVSSKQIATDLQSRMQRYKEAAAGNKREED
jgi:atypical dual specificity phosphatase